MAGSFPYAKFDRTDWVRVPGKARQYRNILNNTIISRRQFDEHYGAVAAYGTNEKKAKYKAREPEALLRPARGRKSALKKSTEEKIRELGIRRIKKEENDADKLVEKFRTKKIRAPHTFTLKNFRRGTSSRRFAVPPSQPEIETIRQGAAKSRIIFSYLVGLMFVDAHGKLKAVSQFSARDIETPYSARDFEQALDIAKNKSSYKSWAGMWMQVILKRTAGVRNGKRYPHMVHMKNP